MAQEEASERRGGEEPSQPPNLSKIVGVIVLPSRSHLFFTSNSYNRNGRLRLLLAELGAPVLQYSNTPFSVQMPSPSLPPCATRTDRRRPKTTCHNHQERP